MLKIKEDAVHAGLFQQLQTLKDNMQKKNGKIVQFSEQELTSCDTIDSGCNGGLMENAFNWLASNGGLATQESYPYTSGSGSSGKCKKFTGVVQVVSNRFVATEEAQIKEELFATGPLSVAINAESSLMSYTGGIIDMDASECDPSALDHGVTIVGYGTENKTDYWIVKNSWGQWGEDGYFRMARGKKTCGINTHVVTATIK